MEDYLKDSGLNGRDRIMFFGSGDFPVRTLRHLIEHGYDITGVVTSHDKLMFKETGQTVRDVAEEHGIPYVIPKSMTEPGFLEWLDEHPAEIFCVISYKFLPEQVLSKARKIAFNIHASLLPYLRGAAPINWAVANGFKETGLTAFVLNNRIDAGDILMNTKTDIREDDNFGTLFKRLTDMCPEFTGRVVNGIADGDLKHPVHQPEYPRKHLDNLLFSAPKLTESMTMFCGLNVGSRYIHDLVRGFSPTHGLTLCIAVFREDASSNVIVKRMKFKVYETELREISRMLPDSLVLHTDFKHELYFYGNAREDTAVVIKRLQIPGKKILPVDEFLRGLVYLNKPDYEMRIIPPDEFKEITAADAG